MADHLNCIPSNPESRFPLTVIVLTRDEESNIRDCLRSLFWAEQVILVDSNSVDHTIHVARDVRPGIEVFLHPFQDFGDQRNWAVEHTRVEHPWVLFLDADERCSRECSEAIRTAVMHPQDKVGFYLCCRNYFLGRWIKRCTYFPSWQLRLLKHADVRFRKEGHGQREVTSGPIGYISVPYDHYPLSKGVTEWIARHNRYSSEELDLIERLRHDPLAPLVGVT